VEQRAGEKRNDRPLMQWRSPVGGGPSSKPCPCWPPQLVQCTSTRLIQSELSSLVPMAPGIWSQKLGQPVPLSNFLSASNNAWSQPAHRNVPARFSSLSGEEKGRSVSSCRSTA